jgi:hypothetical protein
MATIMEKIETGLVTPKVLVEEGQLQIHLQSDMRREKVSWRLKSRALWLSAGDKNASFFHKQSQARKGFNTISKITNPGGNPCTSFEDIKKAVVSHSADLYKEKDAKNEKDREEALSNIPKLIKEDENEKLIQKVSEGEIWNVIKHLHPDKAPGPDGSRLIFIKISGVPLNMILSE